MVDLEEGVDIVAEVVGMAVEEVGMVVEEVVLVVELEGVDLYKGHKASPLLVLELLQVLEGKE